jgi:uncharacterized oxidoreductase
MKLAGNTILITGGGSGIGRALAEMFLNKGNNVIIAGRNQQKLDAVTAVNEGLRSVALDITDTNAVSDFAADIENIYPELNVVIHNAGIMKPEIIGQGDISISEEIININLTSQIRLNSALLPHIKRQTNSTIMTVSSGLAFLPRFDFPTYCATKAAIHSYTQSLRWQLANSNVNVIELVPPYVQTELTGAEQAKDPRAMPLSEFISEVTKLLESEPDAKEITVERVMFQRTAEATGEYALRFKQFQERFSK